MYTIDTMQVDHLVWTNKNSIQRVYSNMKRSSNGAAIIQQTPVQSGFPGVLETLDSWMTRAVYNGLVDHNTITIDPFDITVDGTTMSVVWDNTSGPAIEGEDLWPVAGGCDTLTNVVLKFLTV